jgi:peptidoglycan/xylan/chitin deacetylase (PgdA/CDA1 family)
VATEQSPTARRATDPDFFSSAKSFPIAVGAQIGSEGVRGYYVDFRFKAEKPAWPPSWLRPRGQQMHVATAQWGLGAFERYLANEGEEWRAAAIGAGDYLLDNQEPDGSWFHGMAMPHSYLLEPPWISGMAQGEGASLLVRLHEETGEERYADGALRALEVLRKPVRDGGARAVLGGGPFFEEYPTTPPSFVLNGGIFALWGCYDAGLALDDSRAAEDFAAGADTLAENIERWDTGYWSLYDLFPHPGLWNVASSAYHSLHIMQLRAMQIIAPRPQLRDTVARFEAYEESRLNATRAFASKATFRLITPRNRVLAHKTPWSESRRGRNVRLLSVGSSLVLCYHAVSHHWPSILAVTPDRLRDQLEFLVRHGYSGVTFSELVAGEGAAKAVAITFDDGYRSVLDHGFPILSEFGFPATVFVPTSLVGLSGPMSWSGIDKWEGGSHEAELTPMTWDELRSLRDAGWEIASHTQTHPKLPELGDEELRAELVTSREICTRELGSTCRSIAYPYGAFDDRVVAAARDAGYEAAGIVGLGPAEPLRWPRVGVYSFDTARRFRVKASPLVRTMRSSRAGELFEKTVQLARRPS